jgi:hypothetical protein
MNSNQKFLIGMKTIAKRLFGQLLNKGVNIVGMDASE